MWAWSRWALLMAEMAAMMLTRGLIGMNRSWVQMAVLSGVCQSYVRHTSCTAGVMGTTTWMST
eukprot:scaffold189008_cov14-Prasinocladus_malaysianus.AAC.1